MAEYIDRKAAIAAVKLIIGDQDHECKAMMDFYHALWNIPAADVAPVAHGKWEHDERYEDWADQYLCSVCKYRALTDGDYIHKLSAYCPTCGAKMDLDTANDTQRIYESAWSR